MVELLVAMAIIGMLIAVAIWGISLAQQSSRNTARKTAGATVLAGMSEFYSRFNTQPSAAVANPTAAAFGGVATGCTNCIRIYAGAQATTRQVYDVLLPNSPVRPWTTGGGGATNFSLWNCGAAACPPNTAVDTAVYSVSYSAANGYKICVGMEDLGWANLSENSTAAAQQCP